MIKSHRMNNIYRKINILINNINYIITMLFFYMKGFCYENIKMFNIDKYFYSNY